MRYYLAGALHDIGKLMIQNSILKKPARLTDEEYLVMKNHAFYTHEILKNLKGMRDITDWASHHHEKLNGEGYPLGLTAKQLTLEERLMTCVDIYQALTEERPYKNGKGQIDEQVLQQKIQRSCALRAGRAAKGRQQIRKAQHQRVSVPAFGKGSCLRKRARKAL